MKGAILEDPQNKIVRGASKEHVQHLAPFTVKDIHDAIPAHCFDRSFIRSFSYVAVDLIFVALFVSVGYYFINHISQHTSWPVAILFWNMLWFAQGAVMTGLWVLGHECGHQSFSKWRSVNNFFGMILHSALFVPYHAWRITHGMHHKNTSHMMKDQVYVPKTLNQVMGPDGDDVHNVIAESPLGNVIQILITVTLGWPLYILTNAWGPHYDSRSSHFDHKAPMFKSTQKMDIFMSNAGLIAMTGILVYLSSVFSVATVFKLYFVPYLWCNFWLVTITYLQHTDVRVPHYRGEEWNFIRGAISTIDRDYGFLNIVHHHIADTHVAHHLFSQMPHYHAQEATECIKKVLGKYYLEDKTPVMKALWKSWTSCHYVENDGEVVYYKTMDFENMKKSKKI